MVTRRLIRGVQPRVMARVVYGSIVGLALIVALEQHPPSTSSIVASLVGTGLAIALAEVYSDVLATEVVTRHRVGRHRRREIVVESAAVWLGTSAPAAFFVLSGLEVFELDTAFALAKWSGLGLTAAYGFTAARLADEPFFTACLQATAIALVAAGLILLKSFWH